MHGEHGDRHDHDDPVLALFRRVDDGPSLGIDVRDVMARGRRARARRTALAAAGSALAVAAAVLVSVAVRGEAWSPDLDRPAGPPATVTTETSRPPSPVPVPPSTPPVSQPPHAAMPLGSSSMGRPSADPSAEG